MKKHAIIRILATTLKALVALAAAINLVALFVFHYELPSWLRRGQAGAETAAVEETELDLLLPADEEGVHFAIPVVPVNYSGEPDMDALVLDGVYVQGSDDQPVEDARIEYEILPGDSHQKKTIQYTAVLPDGETLTETRVMNLTARYTGPTITLLGPLPAIDPADADVYAGRLGVKGVIRADDGFGNDVTDQVTAAFDDLSDEYPDSGMTLSIENQVHDTYELDLTVEVQDYSGVVLVLNTYHLTLTEGEDFYRYDFVDYAHDAEGNDLTDDVESDSNVDIYTPGEYEIQYWVYDSEDVRSPTKTLSVTVEPEPEEPEETEEAP